MKAAQTYPNSTDHLLRIVANRPVAHPAKFQLHLASERYFAPPQPAFLESDCATHPTILHDTMPDHNGCCGCLDLSRNQSQFALTTLQFAHGLNLKKVAKWSCLGVYRPVALQLNHSRLHLRIIVTIRFQPDLVDDVRELEFR